MFGMKKPAAPITPPAPVDIAKVIPALKGLERTTVRLHPRRGKAAIDASKIGGTFLWPSGEEWPQCAEHNCPYLCVLQLAKESVPEFGFRKGTDLFQLLWCPNNHKPVYGPSPVVFWRNRERVKHWRRSMPKVTTALDDYVPEPCRLNPERVVEYPSLFELPVKIAEQVKISSALNEYAAAFQQKRKDKWQYPEDGTRLYFSWLSVACGSKIGGHPNWDQHPEYPSCACGKRMECVMTLSSNEFDAETWGRWLPAEERAVLTAKRQKQWDALNPPNWMFGDLGNMYLYICRDCPEWPITSRLQLG